jgi:hypothetical protein
MDPDLPAALRNSSLPWQADLEHSAPAPAPDDSWHALLGTLEWSIVAHRPGLGRSPEFLLGLRSLGEEDEVQGTWTFHSLRDAVVAADAINDILLDQLRKLVRYPR